MNLIMNVLIVAWLLIKSYFLFYGIIREQMSGLFKSMYP